MTAIDPEGMVTEKAPKWRLANNDYELALYRDRRLVVEMGALELAGSEPEALAALVADANAGAQANASAAPGGGLRQPRELTAEDRHHLACVLLAEHHKRYPGAIRCEEDYRAGVAAGLYCEAARWREAAPASPAVDPQAGAISDEELRSLADEAHAHVIVPTDHPAMRRLNREEWGYVQGVIAERKRKWSRAAEIEGWLIAELRAAGCKCGRPLIGYRPGVGPRCRLCNVVAGQATAAPAASPAGGGASGLVRELAGCLSRYQHINLAYVEAGSERAAEEVDLLARAAAFVDPAPALADALRPFTRTSMSESRPRNGEHLIGWQRSDLDGLGVGPHEVTENARSALAAYDAATSTAKPGEGEGR